jgi:hypothetical protein
MSQQAALSSPDNLGGLRDHKADAIGPHTGAHSRHDSAPLADLLASRPIHQRSIPPDVDVHGPGRHAGFVPGGAGEQANRVLFGVLPRITSATPTVPHKHDHFGPPAPGQSAPPTAAGIGQTASSYAFGAVPVARDRGRTLDSLPPGIRAQSPACYARATSEDSRLVPGIPKVNSRASLLLGIQSEDATSLRGGVYRGSNAADDRIAYAEEAQASGNGGHTLDYLRHQASDAGELDEQASNKRQKNIREALSVLPGQDQGDIESPQDPAFISLQGRLHMLLGCGYSPTEPTIHPIAAELPDDAKIRSKVEQLQHNVHQLGLAISEGYVVEYRCDKYLKEVVRYPGTLIGTNFLT